MLLATTLPVLTACETPSSVPIDDPRFGNPGGPHAVVVVLDVSGSMQQEMDAAVYGLRAMLDALGRSEAPDDLLALVTFTGGAVTFSGLEPTATALEELRAAWLGDGRSTLDPDKQSGVTTCFATLCTERPWCGDAYYTYLAGAWMMPCNAVGFDGVAGYSSPGDGVAVADGMLDAAALDWAWDVVLVTDGISTCPGTPQSDANACAADRDTYLEHRVDLAAARGANVWVVDFDDAMEDHDRLLATLPRGHGTYAAASSADDAARALVELATHVE